MEQGGKATHQNTKKSGTPQKTTTMQNTQCNDSTGASQESPEWIHITMNISSSAPPSIIKQERHSLSPGSNAQRVARNATPTSPEYSGSPKREVAHASMNWTDCTNDECPIHLSENRGQAGTHNSPEDREDQVSPTTTTGDGRWKRTQEKTGCHNNLVGGEPEGLITKSWAGSIVSTTIATKTDGKRWTQAITPNRWGKKGHCQSTTGGKTKREEPRGRGWGERGAKKPFETWKLWQGIYQTSEANSVALPNSLWQKTMTWNDSTRRRKNSIKHTIESNTGCAK